MTKLRNTAVVLGTTIILAACADLESVRNMKPDSGQFAAQLHQEYVRLAALEDAERDWIDTTFFNERARMVALGTTVDPQPMAERRIPESMSAALSAARARLVQALATSKFLKPRAAARAQAGFDCWMQEQEENFQPKDIAACKSNFWAAIGDLEFQPPVRVAAAPPAPAPEPALPMAPSVPGPFVVHFEFDSAKLTGAADQVIREAAKQAKAAKVVRALLNGHADRSGSDAYNMRLSKSRTKTVLDALTAQGMPADIMLGKSYGESLPAVNTPDGQPEAANRRVEIIFQR
ncbi:MAG: OmpA family protein [Rhodospirillales bacterium]|nr:OmpA family protein [Rhodospirillales bacterium]